MDRQLEHLDTHDHTPEVGRQQANVEEGCRSHAEDQRTHAVEQAKSQRVPRQVAADRAIPDGRLEATTVEDGGLHAVDDHTPLSELPNDFVQRARREHVFFEDVGGAIEGCT